MPEREQLEQSIAYLEAQRASLGDATVDAALAPLKEKLARFQAPEQAASEERRWVTVLFADLFEFTLMAEHLDAEVVRDVVDLIWQRVDNIICAHGGLVDKHIGDAVMAIWGAFFTHEDDAEQAVRAAMDMQAFMHSPELTALLAPKRLPFGLRMRIGLNSGMALLGTVGSKNEFTAIGDVVNVANRLEGAAPVGGVLISHNTYRQVYGFFEMVPQPPLIIKGRQTPEQTYLVERATPQTFRTSSRGIEGVSTRMVGRQAELQILQDTYLDSRQHSQTKLVLITGEAGVGKSRLRWEFERWLEASGEQPLSFRGRCIPELQHTPYSLLRDLFCHRFEILDSDSIASVMEKFSLGVSPVLDEERACIAGQLLGFDFASTLPVSKLLGGASLAIQGRADLLNYFVHLSAEQPMLWLLEDMQWVDGSSFDFLSLLINSRPNLALLIVGMTRPSLKEDFPDVPAHTNLELAPLSPANSRELVGEILQQVEALPDELKDLIVANTEGNPFYVEELIKMFMEDGVIERSAGAWQVRLERLKQIRVPATLEKVLQTHLDSLSPDEKLLLQRASVIGRLFWDSTVAEMQTENERSIAVPEILAAVEKRQLIQEHEHSAFAQAHEYVFRHALLRDVTYETVLLKLRRVYHRLAAQWLETNSSQRQNEYAGLIAEHYERAGENRKAADWLRQTGKLAEQTSSWPEACAAYEHSLQILPGNEDVDRAAILSRLGSVYEKMRNYSDSERVFLTALELARQVHSISVIAEILNGLCQLFMRQSAYERACSYAEEALTQARPAGDDKNAATALRLLGLIYYYRGDYAPARQKNLESLALCRGSQNHAGVASSLNNLGLVAIAQGEFESAFQYYEEALATYKEIGDRWGTAAALNNMGMTCSAQGNLPPAIQHYQESLALFREINDRLGMAHSLTNLGIVAMMQQDYQASARDIQEGLGLFRSVNDRYGTATCLSNLGHVARLTDTPEQARQYYQEALAEALAIGAQAVLLETLAGLAGVLFQAGDLTGAAELAGLVAHHPAVNQEILQVLQPVQDRLKNVVPAEQLEKDMAHGKILDVLDVARTFLKK